MEAVENSSVGLVTSPYPLLLETLIFRSKLMYLMQERPIALNNGS